LPSCINMAHKESVSIAFQTGMAGLFLILPGIILWTFYESNVHEADSRFYEILQKPCEELTCRQS